MTLTVMPSPYQVVLDGNGDPINGAKVFVYIAGTTTKTDTYTDSTGATANTNPIIADSAGRFVAFLDGTVAYKFVYALADDTDPPTSPFKTVDGILATAPFSSSVTFTGRIGETVSGLDLLYLSDGTGGLTAGRWYKATSSLGYKSQYAIKLAFATEPGDANSTITLIELGALDGFSGMTTGATYYVGATAGTIATTGYRVVGVAASATILDIAHSDPAPFGVDEIGLANGTLAAGAICRLSASGWSSARADTVTEGPAVKNLGFAVETIATGERGVIRRLGVVTPVVQGGGALTVGSAYYLSTTLGAVTATPPVTYPQFPRLVGVAISTTQLSICTSPPLQDFAYYGAVVGNVGGGEDDLIATPVLWANSLSYDGQVVIAEFYGNFAANANNKTLKIKFDGTTVLDSGAAAFQGGWSARMHITRINNGANARVNCTLLVAGQYPFNGNVFAPSIIVGNNIIIKCTGESAAAADNDIVQAGFSYRIGGAWSAGG